MIVGTDLVLGVDISCGLPLLTMIPIVRLHWLKVKPNAFLAMDGHDL